jgi:hypothetical protein
MNRIARSGILMLVTAAFVMACLSAAFADELQPKIVIPKMRHDFGKVYERETFEYTFVVKNHGKADLVIDDVKPG